MSTGTKNWDRYQYLTASKILGNSTPGFEVLVELTNSYESLDSTLQNHNNAKIIFQFLT